MKAANAMAKNRGKQGSSLGAASSLGGPQGLEEDYVLSPYYCAYVAKRESRDERMLVGDSLQVRYAAVRKFLQNPKTSTFNWIADAKAWYDGKSEKERMRIMLFSTQFLTDICTEI